MAIVVESVATGGSPISKPTGLAVGDLLVAALSNDTHVAATVTVPLGWTSLQSGNDYNPHGILAKVADSSDVAASTFTFQDSNAAALYGVLYRLSGAVDPAVLSFPYFTNRTNGASGAHGISPGITPLYNPSLIILGHNVYTTSSGTFSAHQCTTTPTFTERYDTDIGSSLMAVADAPLTTTSEITSAGATCSAAGPYIWTMWGVVIYARQDATATISTLAGAPYINTPAPQLFGTTPGINDPGTPDVDSFLGWTNESGSNTTWTNE